MIDTIVNLDLDFMTKPYYVGNHYVEYDWKSNTEFLSKAKLWIQPEDIINKLNLDVMKGDTVANDKQALFSWEKAVTKNLVKTPFRLVNFDAHLDMYSVNSDGDYYDLFSLSGFNDFDHLIAPFKYGWIDQVDWIIPDYFTIEDIERQFTFIKPIDKENNLFTLYVSDYFDIKVNIIKFSDLNIDEYDIKYFSIVLNSDKCICNDKIITDFIKHQRK